MVVPTFGGASCLDLHWDERRTPLGDEQVIAHVDFGDGHVPAAHEEMGDNGAFTSFAGVRITAGHQAAVGSNTERSRTVSRNSTSPY